MDFSTLFTLFAFLIGAASANFVDPFFWFFALFMFLPPNWIWRFALAFVLAVGYALFSWTGRVSFAQEIGYAPTSFAMILASSGIAFLYFCAFISLVRFALENRTDAAQSGSQTAKSKPLQLSRAVRLALFVAVSWVVCVPSYVFLFQPYGRLMRDDDTLHMIGVIFIPTIIGLGLFFIYRKFIH